MSKECPSCHRKVDKIYQCVDCGKMYCFDCAPFLPLVSQFEALVGDPPQCPDCVGLFRGRGEQVSRDDSEESSQFDTHSDSGSDFSSAGSTSSYKSSSDIFGWLPTPLVLVAIYFLVPVTMTIVAEHTHILGYFNTGFPAWFYLLWPVAIGMTIFLSALELLFVLFGANAPNLNFLISVALPCIACWAVIAFAILYWKLDQT